MQDAIQLLDLIVFVPIEKRDRIPLPASEDLKLRKEVEHEKLQEILFEDSLNILGKIEIIEVAGSLGEKDENGERQIEVNNSSGGRFV